jgi:acyl transferase domain-containing protein
MGVDLYNHSSHLNGDTSNLVHVDGPVKGGVNASGYPNGNVGHVNGNSSHSSNSRGPPPAIALCGIGMRLPGGIRNTESFWDLLFNGKDARRRVPADRYNIDGFHDPSGSPGTVKAEYGHFLDEDLTSLDTSFFSMNKSELERADPQQRQLLEVTRECLENAGEIDWRGKLIGCYVGTFGEDWMTMNHKEIQHAGGHILTGYGDYMLSNRISYEYDFRGPRYA